MSACCNVREAITVPAASISSSVLPETAARPLVPDRLTDTRGEVTLVRLSVDEMPLSSIRSGRPGAASAVVTTPIVRVTVLLLPAASVAVRLSALPVPSPKAM